MSRVVILHGNGNSHGTDDWYPYVKSNIEAMGVECVTPDLPDNILARKKYWFPYFSDVLKLGEDDIVIGASSGALAILKYAEDHKIGASILVGTYYTDLGYEDERTSGYFDTPWDWAKIKANQKWSAIYASTDDPYIPIAEPQFIRDQLGSEYFEFNDRGHFGSHTNPQREFPELLEFLKTKLGLMKVLFICRGNVGRSQAAMSFYNLRGLGHADSAGTLLKYPDLRLADNGVADNVIKVMFEYGIDVSNNVPSQVTEAQLARYDRIIVMAEPDTIPVWLKDSPKTELWNVPDPKGQDLDTTRKIFEEIKERVDSL